MSTTYTAGALDYASVQAAINSGANGDTVLLPAGNGVWTSSIGINSNITLKGAGVGQTVINLSGNIGVGCYMTVSQGTVGWMSIVSNTSGPAVFNITNAGFRLTNIDYNASGSAGYFATMGPVASGLIDHCSIYSGAGNSEFIFVRGATNAWQTPSRCGTPTGVFIENCAFDGPGYVCDANSNAVVIIRYCTISGNMKVDGHGFASNASPPRGVRSLEVYGNSWVNATYAAQIRGGAGYVFNNSVTGAGGAAGTSNWWQFLDYGAVNPWPNYGVAISGVTTGNAYANVVTTWSPHGVTGSGWYVQLVCTTGALLNPALNGGLTSLSGLYQVSGIDSHRISLPVQITGGTAAIASGVIVGATNPPNYLTMVQTPYNYPLVDQIGCGQDQAGKAQIGGEQPVYVWNQMASSVAGQPATSNWPLNWIAVDPPPSGGVALYQQQISNPTATFTMQSIISGGRDIYVGTVGAALIGTGDIGTGVVATMLATPTTYLSTGVGFWATDTGTWNTLGAPTQQGVLFAWGGAASGWRPIYQPYTYPHPLDTTTSGVLTGPVIAAFYTAAFARHLGVMGRR